MRYKLGVCEWSLPVGGPTSVVMAAKMGFTACVLPRSNMRRIEAPEGMRLIPVASLSELGGVL